MRYWLGLCVLFLLGNTPSEADSIPEALKPYVVDGELKTDDFGWMRGAFDGANEQQKADAKAIKLWLKDCMAKAKSEVVSELAAMGIRAATLDNVAAGPALCESIVHYNGMSLSTNNWTEFQNNEAQARLIFSVYQMGAQTARQHSAYEPKWGSEAAWDLLTATVMEQVYRSGLSLAKIKGGPKIDPALEIYFHAHLGNAVQKEDRKNTGILKELVAKMGWPSISLVGERASGNAWLLVQHADHDPAFQLKALRLMEPLAVKGEVRKGDYAYLYDRVMLKLNGKQRFGTQFGGCEGGEYKLYPLEDGDQLDKLRAEYGLEPIAEYRKGMKDAFGPCKEN